MPRAGDWREVAILELADIDEMYARAMREEQEKWDRNHPTWKKLREQHQTKMEAEAEEAEQEAARKRERRQARGEPVGRSSME